MSIEALKEQARRHEQKEDWAKALDQYKKAIAQLEAEDQPDIGLYNRVGDLFVRVGNLSEAVSHYNKSVDLYLEAELPNNAIGVCKKIIRNVPEQHEAFLRMGQIRAQQGFLPDARTNFLTYAERMQQVGDLDESFRALVEFCDLAPDDIDVRIAVAEQMASHDRGRDAVEQFLVAYRGLMEDGDARMTEVGERIHALDPHALLPEAAGEADVAEGAFITGSGVESEGDIGGSFGEIEIGGGEAEAVVEDEQEDEGTLAVELPDFDLSIPGEEAPAEAEEAIGAEFDLPDSGGDDDEEATPLPMLGGDDEEEGPPLPIFGLDDADETEEDATPLPIIGFEDTEEDTTPLPTFGLDAEESEEDTTPLPIIGFEDTEEDTTPLPTFGVDETEEETAPLPTFGQDDTEEEAVPLPTFGVDDTEEEAAPLPTFGADDTEEEAAPLPTFGADDTEEEAVSLPTSGADATEEEAPAPPAVRAMEDAVEEAVSEAREAAPVPPEPQPLTLDGVRSAILGDPENVELRQRMIELAYQSGQESDLVEAFLGLGGALQRSGQGARAKAAFQQVLQFDPSNAAAQTALGEAAPVSKPVKEVAAHEDYVDLGALILGDEEEKTTRFVVAYEEPSGDEAADFAKMLSQFKEKVSQNLDADDVKAHHDLGTAYKEMGLLDEAVAEFQQALRASASHLPTYELLGQTFVEMGQPEAAVRTLERALEMEYEIEDELIAIYYYLARAHEVQGNKASAVEFYDRVFTLDINFADVTERLRALR